MRLRAVLAVGAAVFLFAAGDALAQPGGGRGAGGRGGMFGQTVTYMGLLRVEKVRDAVNLTDDQQEKVQAARRELAPGRGGQAGQGARGGFQDLSDEERREFAARARERAAERTKAEKKALSDILDDGQMKRLTGVYIQVAGAAALDDEDVVTALKISDDQKEKLTAARDDAQAKMREEMRELRGEGDFQAIVAKMAELRKEADKTVFAVLSDEQRQQLDELKGEEIELSQEELAAARGFGRQGRGGGRGQG